MLGMANGMSKGSWGAIALRLQAQPYWEEMRALASGIQDTST